MGRLTSGEFNIYGKGLDQIDIAKENRLRNPNGSHTVLGVLGTTLLPQLISGLTCYAAEGCCGGGSSPKSKTPDEITKEMNSILDKYDSVKGDGNVDANISDLELQIAQKKQEFATQISGFESTYNEVKKNQDELGKKVKESENLANKIEEKTAAINGVSDIIAANNATIEQLKNVEWVDNGDGKFVRNEQAAKEISNLEAENRTQEAKKVKLENEKKELETKKEAVDNECKTLKGKISTEDAKHAAKLNELENTIQEMENDLKKLNDLKGQLKKAEGKDAIENLTNDETDKITKLVKKLTNAKTPEDKAACQKELKDALGVYYAKHKLGDNKTIDKFAASQGQFDNVVGPMPAWTQQDIELSLGFGL